MSKTIKMPGRIESTETGNVVALAKHIYDDAKGKKQSVINSEVDTAIEGLNSGKQDVLTFDNAPTEGSNNPVKSGGVYSANLTLSQAIDAILLLIPSAATALNQLADKAFVNSSIATDTATFRGTSAAGLSEQQFLAWANTLEHDLNDYVFWNTVDNVGNTQFKRYKWNGTAWVYEYTLNNSSFNADQWAAINSTITQALVTKLSALPTATELQIALNEKQDALTFDNVPVAGSNNPVKSGGLYTTISPIQLAVDALTGRMTTAEGNISTNTADIALLQDLYEALTQSALVVVEPTDTWPVANPATSTIYRVVDRVNTPPQNYSDYMWNGSAMVLMATYNNAIDNVPTANSNNLVKSGAVYDVNASIIDPNISIKSKAFVDTNGTESVSNKFVVAKVKVRENTIRVNAFNRWTDSGVAKKISPLAVVYDSSGTVISVVDGNGYDISTWVEVFIPVNASFVKVNVEDAQFNYATPATGYYDRRPYVEYDRNRLFKADIRDISLNANNDYTVVMTLIASNGNYSPASSTIPVTITGDGTSSAYILSCDSSTYKSYSQALMKQSGNNHNPNCYVLKVPLWNGLQGVDERDIMYIHDSESKKIYGCLVNDAIQDFRVKKSAAGFSFIESRINPDLFGIVDGTVDYRATSEKRYKFKDSSSSVTIRILDKNGNVMQNRRTMLYQFDKNGTSLGYNIVWSLGEVTETPKTNAKYFRVCVVGYENNNYVELTDSDLQSMIVSISGNYIETKAIKMDILGDSIIEEGNLTGGLNKLDYMINNYGVSGTTISDLFNNSFLSRYSSMSEDCDVVTVFGGINDWQKGVPVGSFDDYDNDTHTFYGALHALFKGMADKFINGSKTIPIYILIPTHPYFMGIDPDYPPKYEYSVVNNKLVANSYGGGTYIEYVNALREVAQFYSLPIIDLYAESMIAPMNADNRTKYTRDGLHLNAAGGLLVAKCIDSKIEMFKEIFYFE